MTDNIQIQSYTHVRDKELTNFENKELPISPTKNNNKKSKIKQKTELSDKAGEKGSNLAVCWTL